MTREEMSEIFALMLLAWPNAPMFHNGKMKETIYLWTACLPEIDRLTGMMATIQLCRTCKFPPTIAEMREAAENVKEEADAKIHNGYDMAKRMAEFRGEPFDWKEIKESRRRKLLEEMNRTVKALKPPEPDGQTRRT